MEHQNTTFEVLLAGVPMRLKTTHDSATVDALVGLVNEKVEHIQKESPNISYQKAVLLASLHIAEDLLTIKKQALEELDQLEAKAKGILTELESSPISRIRMDN